jgi:integrase
MQPAPARPSARGGRRFDQAGEVWIIPKERMKADREHRVPLSRRAMDMIKNIPRQGDYIFSGAREGKPLSNMAWLELIRGMIGNGYTVHGFRSAFRDWARERTAYPREIAELALAHANKDKTEAAYARGDALDKRRQLMTAWSNYCAMPAVEGEVVSMRSVRS